VNSPSCRYDSRVAKASSTEKNIDQGRLKILFEQNLNDSQKIVLDFFFDPHAIARARDSDHSPLARRDACNRLQEPKRVPTTSCLVILRDIIGTKVIFHV
jgi:hypothetical protein